MQLLCTSSMAATHRICVSVASLWSMPTMFILEHKAPFLSKDLPTHETQLLYGEPVRVLEDNGHGWLKIEAPGQENYDRQTDTWGPYVGWVQSEHLQKIDDADDLPLNIIITAPWEGIFYAPIPEQGSLLLPLCLGTQLNGERFDNKWWQVRLLTGGFGYVAAEHVMELQALLKESTPELRARIVDTAQLLLHSPYVWGGRSAYNGQAEFLTGVDCSGLVNLVFLSCGIKVPRDAHPQFLKADPVAPHDLEPGDLVFLKYQSSKFQRVSHVMVYLGNDDLLEATGQADAGMCVRKISAQDFFGCSMCAITQGMRITSTRSSGDFECYGGSLIPRTL